VLQALRWRPAASIGVPEPRPIQIRIGRFFVHPTASALPSWLPIGIGVARRTAGIVAGS
jgi:hypothetical protein